MTSFTLAAVLFVATHLLISGTSLRPALVAKIGEGGFTGLYVVISLATFGWMLWAYPQALPESRILWEPATGFRDSAVLVVFAAFLLAVPGLLTPNPTFAKQEGQLTKERPAVGMVRITRHPFLAGVALWAVWHALITGHSASVILFGSLALLAILGMASIDQKRARNYGDAWDAFASSTSRVPFAAIIAGRNHFDAAEIRVWRLFIGVVVFVVVLYGHQTFFGVSPLPGGMTFY